MTTHRTETAVSLSDRRRIAAPVYLIMLTIAAAVSWGMAYKGLLLADTDHETRMAKVEAKVEEIPAIKKDIEWLVKVEDARERREGRVGRIP